MVNECKKLGVNDIFVSGLTIRNGYYKQVNAINALLKLRAKTGYFTFIDNSGIRRQHLSYDGLHLEKSGTTILSNNFINALNNIYIFNPVY